MYIGSMSNVSKNYVNVVFCRSPYKEFTYKVPEQFRHDLTLGHRVLVPLGNRKTTGFVVHFVEKTDIKGLKEIEDILDSYPLLNSEMIRLTQWVAIYYMAYWGEVIRAALPPGLHRQTQCMIHISKQSNPSTVALAASEQKILEILRSKKRISLSLLQRYFGKRDIRFVLSKLEKLGLVCIEQILENQKVKNQSEIRISIDQEVDSGVIEGLMKRAPKQASVYQYQFPRNT